MSHMRRIRLSSKARIHLALAAIAAVPLLFVPTHRAHADTRDGVLASASGWYWDRPPPPPGTPAEVGDPVTSQVAPRSFVGDHLYVGWDGTDQGADKREMIAGVNFDLFALGVPEGSTITKFTAVMLEHASTNDRTGNRAQMIPQGIVACPWGSFLAGDNAISMQDAPSGGGDCNQSVLPDSVVDTTPTLTDNKILAWTFNLTSVMNSLWQAGDNISFSLEPNTKSANISNELWVVAFHDFDYSEPPADNPFGEAIPKPGALAFISWVAPASTGEEDFGSGSFDFGTTDGSVFDLGTSTDTTGTPPTASPPTRVAVAATGQKAAFWDIPVWGWFSSALVVMFLLLAGFSVGAPPVVSTRSPGAVAALFSGEIPASPTNRSEE